MGIRDADSAEHGGGSQNLFLVPVACPAPNRKPGGPNLSGSGRIRLKPGSLIRGIYGREAIEEEYSCNYEVNPRYQAQLEAAGMRVVGTGENGEVRAVELGEKTFFIATLYQPPLSSKRAGPHPLILAFLEAAEKIFSREP